ncbi:hypothetical protein K2F43_05405 [Clostridium estertheticum]|nr:hypothetical protein [Clostridium estertheticum]WLC74513.1 hypothetical protein KTC99_17345 [Clostridium estertheticum]
MMKMAMNIGKESTTTITDMIRKATRWSANYSRGVKLAILK